MIPAGIGDRTILLMILWVYTTKKNLNTFPKAQELQVLAMSVGNSDLLLKLRWEPFTGEVGSFNLPVKK